MYSFFKKHWRLAGGLGVCRMYVYSDGKEFSWTQSIHGNSHPWKHHSLSPDTQSYMMLLCAWTLKTDSMVSKFSATAITMNTGIENCISTTIDCDLPSISLRILDEGRHDMVKLCPNTTLTNKWPTSETSNAEGISDTSNSLHTVNYICHRRNWTRCSAFI